jgi:predicted O-linked N-acetylglucosamine transferase (SPINDLY family)
MVGYFDTTGLPTMEWRVTDAAMDPPGQTEQYHTERLARLPNTCWCYR